MVSLNNQPEVMIGNAAARFDKEGNLTDEKTKDFIRQSDMVAVVKTAHPEGIDAVIDLISDRAALQHIAQVLRHGGRLATTVHSMDEISLSKRDIHVIAVDVLRTTTLEAAGDALAQMKAEHICGKVVLTVT